MHPLLHTLGIRVVWVSHPLAPKHATDVCGRRFRRGPCVQLHAAVRACLCLSTRCPAPWCFARPCALQRPRALWCPLLHFSALVLCGARCCTLPALPSPSSLNVCSANGTLIPSSQVPPKHAGALPLLCPPCLPSAHCVCCRSHQNTLEYFTGVVAMQALLGLQASVAFPALSTCHHAACRTQL